MAIEGIETGFESSSIYDGNKNSNNNTSALGMNQFLNLLVAQLKNQDPLSPLDSTEFTAQLAQFTSVEQLVGMNERLAGIQEMLYYQDEQKDLLGLIGKTVKVDDNKILIEDEKVLSGSYSIEDRGEVTVNIFGSDGQKVRTLYFDQQDAGDHPVDWDGKNDSGEMVENGTYTFEVIAQDGDGNYVTANTYISGEVTGVTYEYGQPYLKIGERLINPNYGIIEICKTV